jgi:hypothetical protein
MTGKHGRGNFSAQEPGIKKKEEAGALQSL